MKYLLITLMTLTAANAFAGLTPKRKALYHCVNYDDSSKVTDAIIYESRNRTAPVFHEIEVFVIDVNQQREFSFFKKVNYRPKYDARIESFTRGNLRIKLDHIRAGIDGNIWAFARIPQYGVHSFNWACKNIKGL